MYVRGVAVVIDIDKSAFEVFCLVVKQLNIGILAEVNLFDIKPPFFIEICLS